MGNRRLLRSEVAQRHIVKDLKSLSIEATTVLCGNTYKGSLKESVPLEN